MGTENSAVEGVTSAVQEVSIGPDAPDYVAHRLAVWELARASRAAEAAAARAIRVTLPDGTVKDGVAGQTSPMDIANGISEGFARKAIVAIVNGAQWDMLRPLKEDCDLKICDFSTLEGKMVLWHSTAHILGEAMEYKYQGRLCIGPPLADGGFYYDIRLEEGQTVSNTDFKDLETRVTSIAKSQRTFERLELTKAEALDMFGYNEFKTEIINELDPNGTITAYRDGPFIDLCRGPHVPHSKCIKAVMVTKTGQAYWRAKAENPSLQRVYGISFPDKNLLKEHKKLLEEAAKRDHRKLGLEQELIMFHELSPGSAFFLPHGMRIYNTLLEFIRKEYWKRGYQEVNTPNIFDFALWETSGHAQNYRDDMFSFEVEKRDFGLKPMNCPAHCLMFGARSRSYKELPLRIADFGVLHRNEKSGTLTGLTRVRRFQQDDAHIFCLPSQVSTEIVAYLEFLRHVYEIFGFTFELDLSTRPEEKYLGEISMWDKAEAQLADALIAFTGKQQGEEGGWNLNPGDGAFYGPKIDIKVFDALKRKHQCATVQLDFQQPIRFDLWVKVPPSSVDAGAEGAKSDQVRPVIIHRAIYGSLERFFAIITEHFAGKWPFWLSPRQAIVVPVSEKFMDYAKTVHSQLRNEIFHADVDISDEKLAKKIRNAQLSQYNFILVVGEQEANDGTVNIRTRDNKVEGAKSIADTITLFTNLRANYE